MRVLEEWRFNVSELGAKGRLQYFFHCPSSKLPVRDIFKNKTEPHIEVGAENLVSECWQPNIRSFLEKHPDERYLFLFTRCRNRKELPHYYGKYYIVGYIIKEMGVRVIGERGNEWKVVIGRTFVCSFEDAFRSLSLSV